MKRTPLRGRPRVDHSSEAGYREWKAAMTGECAACGKRGLLLRHHVVTEQTVRREGGDPYDLRNAMHWAISHVPAIGIITMPCVACPRPR